MTPSRRAFLQTAVATVAIGSGCSGGSSSSTGDILVGPGGNLVFEPADLTVESGDRVSWYFDSSGHNVSARPSDTDGVTLPAGAQPFASYDSGGSPMSLVPRGETYRHRFDVPGEYRYVCVPHLSAGMTGRVVAEG